MTNRPGSPAVGPGAPPRPRDALGRPLPPGASGVEPVPELDRDAPTALADAAAYLRAGRPFAAHEVLEGRWKSGPAGERTLWQGLAQLAVGLTHAARGNPVGAERLLARGAGRLAEHAASGGPSGGLDLDAVLAWADEPTPDAHALAALLDGRGSIGA